MAARTPLVLIGSPPTYGGLTELKTSDTIAGVVNHDDFGATEIVVSTTPGTVVHVALTADTVLANAGSGIEAFSFSDLSAELLQLTSLDDFLTLLDSGPNSNDFIVWNSIDSVWENREGTLGILSDVDLSTPPTAGQRLVFNGTSWVPEDDAPTDGATYGRRNGFWARVTEVPVGISVTLSTLTTGVKAYWTSPIDWEITGWYVVGESAANVVIDVWKSVTIPSASNTITGIEKPTLVGSQLASDTTLTSWINKDISTGDVLAFNIDSTNGGANYVTLSITGRRI